MTIAVQTHIEEFNREECCLAGSPLREKSEGDLVTIKSIDPQIPTLSCATCVTNYFV